MRSEYVPYLMAIVGSIFYLLGGWPTPSPPAPDPNAWLRMRVGELALWVAAAGFFAIAFEHLTLR